MGRVSLNFGVRAAFFLKKEQVQYLQKCQGIYGEYGYEPGCLAVAGSLPQSHALPGKRPAYKNEEPNLF